MKADMETLNNLMKIQGTNGNWNYDPYMQGMYNGMEMMISIINNRDPKFKSAPKKWVKDKKTKHKLTAQSESKTA